MFDYAVEAALEAVARAVSAALVASGNLAVYTWNTMATAQREIVVDRKTI